MSSAGVIFRRTDNIGAPDARDDRQLLTSCFIDTGIIQALTDCENSACILLGRTGAGKTALLEAIKERKEKHIDLAPEVLSLNHLINSNVLNFYESAGVHLDAFYKLLWEHVFAVELIKAKYDIKNEDGHKSFMRRIVDAFGDEAKKQALNYMSNWAGSFWIETSTRVREFTTKLETDLNAHAGTKIGTLVDMGAKGAMKLSEEEKSEVVERGQKIVNSVHIRALQDLLRTLNEDIFDDPQNPYYILIDRLDENWVDDRIRYRLIRAMIEAVRSFRQVRNVKILASLRDDLLHSVIKRTSQAGYQAEKYSALFFPIRWSRNDLHKLLDARANVVFRARYTKQHVSINDILPPNQMEQRSAADYILNRTTFRPREAIMFVNECIHRADGRAKITVDNLKAAEGVYSNTRLESIRDEWAYEFPCCLDTVKLLQNRSANFSVSEITESEAYNVAEKLTDREACHDPAYDAAVRFIEGKVGLGEFRNNLVSILYQLCIVGLKLAPNRPLQWAFTEDGAVYPHQIAEDTNVSVHKAFWLVLNISPKRHGRAEQRGEPLLEG